MVQRVDGPLRAADGGDAAGRPEDLSALMDGEVDAEHVAVLVDQWREWSDVRGRWHAFHVIGDVLRSEDFSRAHRDRGFVRRLHQRLLQEPPIVAPLPSGAAQVARKPRVRRWAAPVGVAAGVTLVAGTLLMGRVQLPGGITTVASANVSEAALAVPAQPVRVAVEPGTVAAAAVATAPEAAAILRDPRLDRYLAAHKQFQGASALGATPGFIRSATYDMATR